VGIGAPTLKYLVWQWLEKIVLGINFCQIIGYSEYFFCGNCHTLPRSWPADVDGRGCEGVFR
jgi:hypothetical protein